MYNIELGYVDVAIPEEIDIFEKIIELKEKKNVLLLAHYYQNAEIQDIADFVGDSLALAQRALHADKEIILFCGVHFMAETAKILNPQKKVLLPDMKAGCSLSDSCPPSEFRIFKENHPDHKVISYINCSAEIKTLSDVICTSSNAKKIVDSFPEDQPLIFAPDVNLGKYINKITGRNMLLWKGSCMVHELFSLKKITELRIRHPNALLIAHPECEASLLDTADYIGSTSGMIEYVKKSEKNEFIVATEAGILHPMLLVCPEKTLIPAPPNNHCACNDCGYMKLNTLEKTYNTLMYELPEIILPQEWIVQARKPIMRMLEISGNL